MVLTLNINTSKGMSKFDTLAELFNWQVRKEDDTWYMQDAVGNDLLTTKNLNAFEFDFVDLLDWKINESFYKGVIQIKERVRQSIRQAKYTEDLKLEDILTQFIEMDELESKVLKLITKEKQDDKTSKSK